MGHSSDIVAYTYRADNYCPACIAHKFSHFGSCRDGSAKACLEGAALRLGIDRMDESTYDSGDFPKVVFRDQIEDPEYCGECLCLLG